MIDIKLNVGHLLISLILAAIIYSALAGLIHVSGFVIFDAKSFFVSIPTVAGVMMLIILSAISSGEIPWSKQGHDFSILAFGAEMSTATLQFFWKEPALPRLAHGGLGLTFSRFFENDLRFMILVLLFCLAIITLVVCIITALIEVGLKNATAGPLNTYRSVISFVNYLLGTISLAFYVTIVCGGI
jgi:hypothetical protein